MKKALIIIDMLNDFIQPGAPLEVPGGREIVPNIKREINKAHQEGYPVFYICDSHTPDDLEMSVWPNHAMEGTPGAEIVSELAPTDTDVVIPKKSYDCFYGTDLEKLLKAQEITHLIVTGVTTEICIHYTGASAIVRGYHVTVPPDCVSALFEDTGQASMKMLGSVLQPKADAVI